MRYKKYKRSFKIPSLKRRTSNVEFKCYDVHLAPISALTEFPSTVFTEPGVSFGGATCLNEIQSGSAYYQRIGSKVVVRSVSVKVIIYCSAACPAGQGTAARALLIYDNGPNGAFPPLATVLFSGSPGATSYNSGINIAYKDRFQVMRDEYFNLDFGQSTTKQIEMYAKGNYPSEYITTTGTIGDLTRGAIYFMLLLAPTASNNIGMYGFCSRLRYTD